MVHFESDYIAGAHPEVMQRLMETNLDCVSGYGEDEFCAGAKQKIAARLGLKEPQIEFLAGGTQTNAVVIATMLKDYEGVVAARTGHISVHEAAAVEYTGHEVLELPQENGKISAQELQKYLETFYADESYEHMCFPGMVYISHPTEYGTLYTKAELEAIAAVCRRYEMPLFMDGARLAYGLMSRDTDVSLDDIVRLCDVFYIGGTKAGALCGEAVVFTHGNRPPHFMTSVKKRGALLAKGRLLGVQFDALFTDELYFRIGCYGIEMAEKLKEIIKEAGLKLYIQSPTNQQFVIMKNEDLKKLEKEVVFSFWEKYDEDSSVVRFATSWSTTEEDLEALRKALAAL